MASVQDVNFDVDAILRNVSFLEYQNFCVEFGSKTAGLMMLPKRWVPDFLPIEVGYYESWLSGSGSGALEAVCTQVLKWAHLNGHESIILRTSGRNETIKDRGKYRSKVIKCVVSDAILSGILEIYQECVDLDPSERMGIVAQVYIDGDIWGHLSNELRVSPTRNQWQWEGENPRSSRKGLNGKFAVTPDPNEILRTNGSPHNLFRSIANWCASNIRPRCHLEWVIDGNMLNLLQLDLEWRELESGEDPSGVSIETEYHAPKVHSTCSLSPYRIGEPTRWRKLKNLSDFDFSSTGHSPRIYECTAEQISKAAIQPDYAEKLAQEINEVSAGRVVVRTDVDQHAFSRYNLPRTDTVSGEAAVSWAIENLSLLVSRGALTENIVFLLHGFIPAKASAWVYASPGRQEVIVDALWGLPDGIQVLPVDTYEVLPSRNKIIQTRSTFKPMFLAEDTDGSWRYVQVLTSKGRSQVLKKSDILEIATRTKSISDKLGSSAQIMWFCQIDPLCELGQNLPWFRSSDLLGEASRSEDRYEDFIVSGYDDLSRIPSRKVALVYQPSPELIRSDDFLEKVVHSAKELAYPVKLYGSVLGHVYYRLCQENVPVILPNASRYKRVRDRRVFGKIVRDQIPANIHAGGESVREAALLRTDILLGLSGKLFEEAEEFLSANTSNDRLSELSDMLEVIRGLAHHSAISFEEIVQAADKKRNKSGGFEERRVLLETSLPKGAEGISAVQEVTLANLYSIEVSDFNVRIPVSGLISTIGRRPVEFKLNGVGLSMKAEIKMGALELSLRSLESRKRDSEKFDQQQLTFLDKI